MINATDAKFTTQQSRMNTDILEYNIDQAIINASLLGETCIKLKYHLSCEILDKYREAGYDAHNLYEFLQDTAVISWKE
jgi:hypothetical protein